MCLNFNGLLTTVRTDEKFYFLSNTLFLGTSAISANDELPINLTSHEILTKGKVLASGGISGNEPFSELKIVVHYVDEIFFCVTKLRVIHPSSYYCTLANEQEMAPEVRGW